MNSSMSFPTKLQDARIIVSFPPSVLLSSVFLLTLARLCSPYSEKVSISPRLSLSLYVCASVCLLWCVLQFRTLKQSKIPVGEETQVQSAGGVTAETSWCWQTFLCLCLSLSSPSCFLPHSLFLPLYFYLLLRLVFSVFASLSISISQYIFICTPLPPTLHRVSAAPSRCRCGSTSCVGSVATCGRSFRQTWPRRCLARCCQRLYNCWCRDMPGPVLHTRDTCKSGTLSCSILASITFTWEILSHSVI